MWIILLGASGTCKRAVVDDLVKNDGFIFEHDVAPEAYRSPFCQQVSRICQRWRQAVSLTKRIEESDFLTVRSFWDTSVYTDALMKMKDITSSECGVINEIYDTLSINVPMPHAVLFFRASEMQSHNRQAMTGREPGQSEFELLVKENYEKHIRQIRLPCVEIDVTDEFEPMMEEVRVAINAFRSSNVGASTIWKRSYFK